MATAQPWDNALSTAILAARRGREVLLHYKGRLQHIEAKFQAGLVSEADKESEKAIFEILRKNFPNDEFLGEESAAASGAHTPLVQITGKNGRWIVDPLDGTTNYIHQFPVFCVSIGYEFAGQTQVAVIDVPMLGEVYTAVRGQGAFVNGRRLQVSKTSSLEDAFAATGFFTEIETRIEEQLQIFGSVVRDLRAVRRAGAAAYDLCQVAAGVFDVYWERGLYPWDSSAGQLLVEEAGGVVTTYRGTPYHPFKNSLIAGNPAVVKALQARIAPLAHADSD